MPQNPLQASTRTPTAGHHVANKAYVDDAILAGGGGGPVGDVEITGDLTVDGAALFKGVCVLGTDPGGIMEAAPKRYVDAATAGFARLTGATFSGSCSMPGLTVIALAGQGNGPIFGTTPPNPNDSSTYIPTTAWVQALIAPLIARITALESALVAAKS